MIVVKLIGVLLAGLVKLSFSSFEILSFMSTNDVKWQGRACMSLLRCRNCISDHSGPTIQPGTRSLLQLLQSLVDELL